MTGILGLSGAGEKEKKKFSINLNTHFVYVITILSDHYIGRLNDC